MRAVIAGLLFGLSCAAAACGGSSPTAASPATTSAPAPTGPRLLVAGQSGAYFLAPYLPGAIDQSNIDGSVDFWLTSSDFARIASSTPLEALIWFQGGRDIFMPEDEYTRKLRAVIAIARSANAALPIRIVEIPDPFGSREPVKRAQREVATDPGVELIPTGDLPLDDTNHLTPAANQVLRDRIFRSLGR